MQEKFELQKLDGIIFDLGGVILDIDYLLTEKAFEKLGISNFASLYSQAAQSGMFDDLETGKISGQLFVNHILSLLPTGISANNVISAWNAMILDFPQENLDFISLLHKEIPIFLLSNTNEIHAQCFNRKLKKKTGNSNLNSYFQKVYLSHEIQLRKPNGAVFEFVCESNNLNPQKTLFIDDSIQHIEGAKNVGLQTHHFLKGESILELF